MFSPSSIKQRSDNLCVAGNQCRRRTGAHACKLADLSSGDTVRVNYGHSDNFYDAKGIYQSMSNS
jgi:hypothetical protein